MGVASGVEDILSPMVPMVNGDVPPAPQMRIEWDPSESGNKTSPQHYLVQGERGGGKYRWGDGKFRWGGGKMQMGWWEVQMGCRMYVCGGGGGCGACVCVWGGCCGWWMVVVVGKSPQNENVLDGTCWVLWCFGHTQGPSHGASPDGSQAHGVVSSTHGNGGSGNAIGSTHDMGGSGNPIGGSGNAIGPAHGICSSGNASHDTGGSAHGIHWWFRQCRWFRPCKQCICGQH